MFLPTPTSMDTGIISALVWINLTTWLLRFASFDRAALHAPVTRRATSYGLGQKKVSIQPGGDEDLCRTVPSFQAPYRPTAPGSPPSRRAVKSLWPTC